MDVSFLVQQNISFFSEEVKFSDLAETFTAIIALLVSLATLLYSQSNFKLTSYISVFMSFRDQVQSASTSYSPNYSGVELYFEFEESLILILNQVHLHEKVPNKILGGAGVAALINKKESLPEMYKQFVDCHQGQLIHYIGFFESTLPSIQLSLNQRWDKHNRMIFNNLVRSSVTIHEWAFLAIYAKVVNNTQLMEVVRINSPEGFSYAMSRIDDADKLKKKGQQNEG